MIFYLTLDRPHFGFTYGPFIDSRDLLFCLVERLQGDSLEGLEIIVAEIKKMTEFDITRMGPFRISANDGTEIMVRIHKEHNTEVAAITMYGIYTERSLEGADTSIFKASWAVWVRTCGDKPGLEIHKTYTSLAAADRGVRDLVMEKLKRMPDSKVSEETNNDGTIVIVAESDRSTVVVSDRQNPVPRQVVLKPQAHAAEWTFSTCEYWTRLPML